MPGPAGVGVALAAEAAISFLLLTAVLHVSGSRYGRWTGVVAGALVALYIAVEAPISGMSMNPARSFASALVSGKWTALWIYFVGPPLAMLLAATLYARRRVSGCAKLVHAADKRCIFCEERARRPGTASPRRIVILGGIFTARRLQQLLGGKSDYEIVLVSKENYFVFQPMLPEVISGTIGLTDLVSPIRQLVPGAEIQDRKSVV